MSMDWLRWHHGTVNDPKWRVVAADAGVKVRDVLAVWAAMLECASQAEQRGTLVGWNDRVVGAALDMTGDEVAAVRAAMDGLVLDGDRISAWDKRQSKREDGAAVRAKEWRERKRTQANADERTGTPDKIREDKKEITPSLSPLPGDATPKVDSRGSRWEHAGIGALPDDWRQFAGSLGLDPDRVWLAFTDYWRAAPGAKGRKADWHATWRSWCRREAESGKTVAKLTASAAPRVETYDDREAREAKRLAEGVDALKAGRPPPAGWSKIDTSRAFSRGLIDAAMAERAGLPISIRTPMAQGAE